MRSRSLSLALLVLLVMAIPAAGQAAAPKPTIALKPFSVKFGHAFTVRGAHWAARAGCGRIVVGLRGGRRAITLGSAKVGPRGGWSFRYVPRRRRIGEAVWTLTALERCTGPTFHISGTARVSIHG